MQSCSVQPCWWRCLIELWLTAVDLMQTDVIQTAALANITAIGRLQRLPFRTAKLFRLYPNHVEASDTAVRCRPALRRISISDHVELHASTGMEMASLVSRYAVVEGGDDVQS